MSGVVEIWENSRDLTAQERRWLELVLSGDSPSLDPYKEQAKKVIAMGRCTCGCRTIELGFRTIEGLPKGAPGDFVLGEAVIETDNGEISVLLHSGGGLMTELEVIFDHGVEAFPLQYEEKTVRLFY